MTHVLIIDDDEVDRLLIARRLSRISNATFITTEASKLSDAIDIVNSQQIDVVLLDLHLIETDGLETLKQFIKQSTDIAVVVLTGSTDDHVAMQAIEAGAQDFIRKSDIGNPWLHRCLENAMKRHELQQELKKLSFRDSLTCLPNRVAFENRLESSFDQYDDSSESNFTVVFIDLDEFKLINDCYGHTEGDRVLVEFANRVKSCVRSTDTVARFGGDEFVVLLNSISSDSDISKFISRLNSVLEKPLTVDGHDVFLSASVGYVSSCGRYSEFKHMLRDADTAMYEAKKAGKRTHRRFSQTMRENAVKAVGLDARIRQALACDEFEVHYQPIVDLETRQTIKFEALIRWNHPIRGTISPLNFIPYAERTGLITQIGQWVLEAVCQQIKQWDLMFPENSMTVNVNVSAIQVQDIGFVESIAKLLETFQLTGDRITLEITESTIMENPDETIGVLQQVRQNGTQISIDDFGTGHSSLAKLHRFGFDSLKIDRAFVQEMLTEGYAELLVKTILLLADSIGLEVVAEGIETQAEADRLVEMGCSIGQGFFFGKPMPASEASALVESLCLGKEKTTGAHCFEMQTGLIESSSPST
ncbi:MAG: putative bifunctional diguanylate cyclase/phosphodiesterase [Mariniblastus sp.]